MVTILMQTRLRQNKMRILGRSCVYTEAEDSAVEVCVLMLGVEREETEGEGGGI